MRNLSFAGYLKKYLNSLSGEKTLSLAKLIQVATKEAPRLAEPLYLYAAVTGQRDRLLSKSRGLWFFKDYKELSKHFSNQKDLLAALEDNDGRIPQRYYKVYENYLSVRDGIKTDREFNLLARDATVRILKNVGISKYRVYTDLGLNPGNVNDYLKNGAVDKVSRKTAKAILDYVQELGKV